MPRHSRKAWSWMAPRKTQHRGFLPIAN
jgi:hypothetical protein